MAANKKKKTAAAADDAAAAVEEHSPFECGICWDLMECPVAGTEGCVWQKLMIT
jgi:hypothetical protein